MEAPTSANNDTAEAVKIKITDVFRKKVPVWLCAAIAGGIFAVMLIIMVCTVANLNGQLHAYQTQYNEHQNQPIAENTLEWYQQTVCSQDGKAYAEIQIMAARVADFEARSVPYSVAVSYAHIDESVVQGMLDIAEQAERDLDADL